MLPALAELIRAARPEIVFHLAAQPLVRASYRDPLDTFATNVMGTAHVLEALRGLASVRVAVMVTTDKVYREAEVPGALSEDDPLGGHDPYSASKAAAEMVIASYRAAYFSAAGVAVASARAGNVIGGGELVRRSPHSRCGPRLGVRQASAGPAPRSRAALAARAGAIVGLSRAWRNGSGQQPSLAGAYNFGPEIE